MKDLGVEFFEDLDEMLSLCDIVTINVPLTDKTKYAPIPSHLGIAVLLSHVFWPLCWCAFMFVLCNMQALVFTCVQAQLCECRGGGCGLGLLGIIFPQGFDLRYISMGHSSITWGEISWL